MQEALRGSEGSRVADRGHGASDFYNVRHLYWSVGESNEMAI